MKLTDLKISMQYIYFIISSIMQYLGSTTHCEGSYVEENKTDKRPFVTPQPQPQPNSNFNPSWGRQCNLLDHHLTPPPNHQPT